MKNKKLKIGRIPYANLFPTFYYLETKCDLSPYTFFEGVPSTLNKMLRKGSLDVSPSSSIEFLRNKERYCLIPWLSISSSGAIGSILLFSKTPLEALDGKSVAVSSDSDTSVVLLKVILKEFFSFRCTFQPITSRNVMNILTSFDAVLHIGDTAMREAKNLSGDRARKPKNVQHPSLHIYDLGELWFRHTGLPFVFALWIVRKDAASRKKDLLKRFSMSLIKARQYACRNFPSIARHAPQVEWLSIKELVKYWRSISYDFTGEHLEGLGLFEEYVRKHSL